MIVVTGGAGFIGSNIVAALEEQGRGPVVVCDRLRDGDKWRNIAKRELADIVYPDALFAYLDDHVREIEAIVHMGAISSTTETDADLIVETNFRLSMALWRWCAANGVRLIYASSAATYGDGAHGFVDDTAPDALARLRPLNAYGWSKHLFDRRVIRMAGEGAATPPQWAGAEVLQRVRPQRGPQGLDEERHRPYLPDGQGRRDGQAVQVAPARLRRRRAVARLRLGRRLRRGGDLAARPPPRPAASSTAAPARPAASQTWRPRCTPRSAATPGSSTYRRRSTSATSTSTSPRPT